VSKNKAAAATGANTAEAGHGALSGLKVVDLSRVLAGPFCSMILADHGADVTKVEPPQGDETRDWGPPFLERDDDRDASYFLGLNRNKRSVALDLSHPEGKKIVWRLLEGADILIENFKPGTMVRWGLDYHEHLERHFPRLIHCRISGFGQDGPLGGLPGYDAALQAMSGLMSVNGDPAEGGTRLGCPMVDLSTGMYSAIAILMAVHERSRSNRGQFIDMTLHDCAYAILHPQAANYLLSNKRPVSLGNSHPNLAPCEKLKTAGGEIFVAVGNDAQFRRFVEAIGRKDLAMDARFRLNSDRVTNMQQLAAELQSAVAQDDARELAQRLLLQGIPAGAVLYVDEALSSPHVQHRNMVVEIDGQKGIGTPIKFSRSKPRKMQLAPRFAEHTRQVLADHQIDNAEDLAARRVMFERRSS
jgi:formyl-CoA transferase